MIRRHATGFRIRLALTDATLAVAVFVLVCAIGFAVTVGVVGIRRWLDFAFAL